MKGAKYQAYEPADEKPNTAGADSVGATADVAVTIGTFQYLLHY